VAIVVGLGAALMLVSLGLAIRSQALIDRFTPQPLGSFAAGFAATQWGFLVYVGLVESLGLAVLGVGMSAFRPSTIQLLWVGSGEFVGLAIAAIIGEVRTFRALKH
jgi:hypothetical protein